MVKIRKINKSVLLSLLAFSIASCATLSKKQSKKNISSIEFEELSIPKTEAERSAVRVSPKAKVTYSNGISKEFDLSYKTVFRNGDKSGENIIGSLVNKKGNLLYQDGELIVSDRIDGNSIIKKNGRNFLITHFETYPGALFLSELENKKGNLVLKSSENIDFSSVNGTMINCASSVTPWNTHLSAEEDFYFDGLRFDKNMKKYDPANISICDIDENNQIQNTKSQFCYVTKKMRDTYLNSPDEFTPYDYGYIFEVGIRSSKLESNPDSVDLQNRNLNSTMMNNPDLEGLNVLNRKMEGYVKNDLKHYAMGKGTPEIAVVMPDNRTTYITDDGTFRGLYMFVSDKKNDLSKGTLYMARWSQISSEGTGAANLDWVKLGHGKDSEIKKIIDKKPLFSDIFEVSENNECNSDGFKVVKSGDAKPVCLRLRDGLYGSKISSIFENGDEVRQAGAFLETRRYGAYLGGTAEFRKEEAITYDPDNNKLYLAMSEINKSMLKGYKNQEPKWQDHIKLPRNDCGAVYEMGFGKSIDSENRTINSKYVSRNLSTLLSGKKLDKTNPLSKEHYCDPNYMANPDNLQYISHNILMIAEDTSYHANGFAWAYDVKTEKLTRIMSAPVGAEFSGMFSNAPVKNKQPIFVVVQHPFRGYSVNLNKEPIGKDIFLKSTADQKRSQVGYIDGLPNLK